MKWGKIVDNQQIFNQEAVNQVGQGSTPSTMSSSTGLSTVMGNGQNVSSKKGGKIWLLIGGAVACVVTVAVGVVIFSQVAEDSQIDYGASYRAARTVSEELNKISVSGKCRDMVDYVFNTTADTAKYEGYVAKCNEMATNTEELVGDLGATDGVKQVPEVKAKFEEFRQQLAEVMPNENELKRTTELYQIMHKFALVEKEVRGASGTSEQTYREIANILIDSGDEGLKSYGDEWLVKKLAWWQKVQEYESLDTRDRQRIVLREEASKMDTELKQWERENLPESMTSSYLDSVVYHEMYVAFEELQKMIVANYEQNYDDSGDCSKILDEVICY